MTGGKLFQDYESRISESRAKAGSGDTVLHKWSGANQIVDNKYLNAIADASPWFFAFFLSPLASVFLVGVLSQGASYLAALPFFFYFSLALGSAGFIAGLIFYAIQNGEGATLTLQTNVLSDKDLKDAFVRGVVGGVVSGALHEDPIFYSSMNAAASNQETEQSVCLRNGILKETPFGLSGFLAFPWPEIKECTLLSKNVVQFTIPRNIMGFVMGAKPVKILFKSPEDAASFVAAVRSHISLDDEKEF